MYEQTSYKEYGKVETAPIDGRPEGTIVRIRGSIVDVRFTSRLPELLHKMWWLHRKTSGSQPDNSEIFVVTR